MQEALLDGLSEKDLRAPQTVPEIPYRRIAVILRYDADLLAGIQIHAGGGGNVHIEGIAVLLQQLHQTYMHAVCAKVLYDAPGYGTVLITVIHHERIIFIQIRIPLKTGCMGIFKIN